MDNFHNHLAHHHHQVIQTLSFHHNQNQPPTLENASFPSTFCSNALIEEASQAYSLGDWQMALACYQRLVQIEPDNNVLYANKSAILLRMDRKEEALEAADKAIELNIKWPKAYFRKGEAFFALDQVREAIMSYGEAIKLSQGQEAQFRAAFIKAVEKCPEIGASFTKTFSQFPLVLAEDDFFILFLAVAESFIQADRWPKMAIKMLKIAVDFPSPSPQISLTALGHLALAEYKAGNFEGALEAMEGQLQIAIGMGDECSQICIHGILAEFLARKMSNLEKAIWHRREQLRIGEKINKKEQGWPNKIRLELAKLQMAIGEVDRSHELFKSILLEEPSNCMALLGLGQTHMIKGDLSSALCLFIRVERLESEYENDFWREAILLRAKCQLVKGELGRANEMVEKLMKIDERNGEKCSNGEATEFKAEVYKIIAQLEMTKHRPRNAVKWAKRLLKIAIEMDNLWVKTEALGILMSCNAQMGQWSNADKLAQNIWDLCENDRENDIRFTRILEEIYQFWRIMDKHEKAIKVIEKQLAMAIQGKQKAGLQMELAKIEMENGNMKRCAGLIDKVNEYILWGSNEEMIRKEEKDEEEEKNGIANHWLLVSIVQMKAEINWRKGLKDEARNQMEQALMLAQEQGGLIMKEAWICERLGEMAEEQGELDEAGIYLKQAIGLGTACQQQQKGKNIFTNDGGRITSSSSWHHAMENAKILLRAFDCLSRVIMLQDGPLEDALLALRNQLRLQRRLGRPCEEKTRTMTLLARIFMETGAMDTAEKLLIKIMKREKSTYAGIAEDMLTKCRVLAEKEEDNDSKKSDDGDADNGLEEKNKNGNASKQKRQLNKRNTGRNYRLNKQSDTSDLTCITMEIGRTESDVESTISGAFVLGVDMDDEENNE